MANAHLDFEKPVIELEEKIRELAERASRDGADTAEEMRRLEKKLEQVRRSVYGNLTPWQRTLLARHPLRPYTLDYVSRLVEGFYELHGDRRFGDDPAVVAGIGRFRGRPVAVVGHQKGRNTREKIERNFGMPNPEGYRKALRVMRLAAKFGMPVITFIDTPGAYPGMGAEERGQAEAIARNLYEMSRLPTPIVVVISGEGGSGGALAIGVGDRILMFEHAVYSVISPESCSSILWRETSKAEEAARALKITAEDLAGLGVVDAVLPEPPGGAHRDPDAAAQTLARALEAALAELKAAPAEELPERRFARFRSLGFFHEGA